MPEQQAYQLRPQKLRCRRAAQEHHAAPCERLSGEIARVHKRLDQHLPSTEMQPELHAACFTLLHAPPYLRKYRDQHGSDEQPGEDQAHGRAHNDDAADKRGLPEA